MTGTTIARLATLKHLAVGVTAGLLIGATGAPALNPPAEHQPPTPRQAAKALALDYLAPLVAHDTRPIRITGARCRRDGRWYGCRVVVQGETTCRALVRVRPPRSAEYTGWVPRMRCR